VSGPRDPSIAAKVIHVQAAGQSRRHHCHWPGCDKQVPPAAWGCSTHWYRLPKAFRDQIWVAYRPGQEIDQKPSEKYIEVAKAVRQWIRENHPSEIQTHEESMHEIQPQAPSQDVLQENAHGDALTAVPDSPGASPASADLGVHSPQAPIPGKTSNTKEPFNESDQLDLFSSAQGGESGTMNGHPQKTANPDPGVRGQLDLF
jgi:hypothetical protein